MGMTRPQKFQTKRLKQSRQGNYHPQKRRRTGDVANAIVEEKLRKVQEAVAELRNVIDQHEALYMNWYGEVPVPREIIPPLEFKVEVQGMGTFTAPEKDEHA